ncbi:MAG TPA: histidine phosphatase family protein [Streptosporangiaceae bacterium]|nr:histidine phosphatase family protein [Streptosporangiaceae bacterium]
MSAGPRQLVVMRHAKAAQLPGSPDFERPLTARGHRDAAAAGHWLAGRGLQPDAVLCSPARRTLQTWQAVAAELGREVSVPNLDDTLYTADAAAIREIIAATAPDVTTLLCVGHNPAMARLAADATGQPLEFPTAAIAVAALPGPWASVADGPGDLAAYWTPKLAAR